MDFSQNLLAVLGLAGVIVFATALVLALWLHGRRQRRRAPVYEPRRRLDPEPHPVPSRDPQPTSEDHEIVEAFLRSLDHRRK